MHKICSSFYCPVSCQHSLEIRGNHLYDALEETVSGINQLFSGVILGLFSLATFGLKEKNTTDATHHLLHGGVAASAVYSCFLKSLNPEAEISQISLFGAPLYWINNQAFTFAKSPHLIKKHLFSRGAYAALAVSAVIIRIAEGVIGLIATIFSCLTLGIFPRLNLLASSGLRFPLLLRDLFLSATNFIHPGSVRV